MSSYRYALGHEYPNEGFVQRAIEEHFSALGFKTLPSIQADLRCTHPETGEEWLIEAKGLTSQVGLDFGTGLGQLVQRMQARHTKYGLAIPNISKFRKQCLAVVPWVRQAIGIHWILIYETGDVRIVSPLESL